VGVSVGCTHVCVACVCKRDREREKESLCSIRNDKLKKVQMGGGGGGGGGAAGGACGGGSAPTSPLIYMGTRHVICIVYIGK
jgi:hypothetical protein